MSEFSQGPVLWQAMIAIVIFAAAYVCLLIEKWDRTYTALGGALLMIVLGIVPIGQALSTYANWHTILFIVSLFAISGVFQKTGLIAYAASSVIQKYRFQPFTILIGLSLLTAVVSALLDSLLAIAIIVPAVLSLSKAMKLSPAPFLISLILSANIGGAATLLGNMPNRMVGLSAPLTMAQFLLVLTPLVIVMLVIIYIIMWLIYGKKLVPAESYKKDVSNLQPSSYLTQDRVLLIGGSAAAAVTFLLLILQGVLGWNASYIALGGAVVLLALNYKEIVSLARSKEYRSAANLLLDSQLFFFLGLFIMAGGIAHAGVSGYIAARGLEVGQGSVTFMSMLVLWLTGFGTAMMDNIPYVAAITPVLQHMQGMLMLVSSGTAPVSATPLWWSLLIGAAIGGGATLLGSAAGMLAAGLAGHHEARFSQRDYMIIAAPISLLLIVVATVYFNLFLL